MYCRWCGSGGKLFLCSTCDRAFCQRCVRSHLGAAALKSIKANDAWRCLACDPAPLEPMRAAARAFIEKPPLTEEEKRIRNERRAAAEAEARRRAAEDEETEDDRPVSEEAPLAARPRKGRPPGSGTKVMRTPVAARRGRPPGSGTKAAIAAAHAHAHHGATKPAKPAAAQSVPAAKPPAAEAKPPAAEATAAAPAATAAVALAAADDGPPKPPPSLTMFTAAGPFGPVKRCPLVRDRRLFARSHASRRHALIGSRVRRSASIGATRPLRAATAPTAP
jgi:hypothetical protein